MIDFRYHLVSIIAIFLALTLGIVLGSTVLEDPLIRSAEATSNQLSQTNEELREQVRGLEAQSQGAQTFIQSAMGPLVKEKLTGQRVLLVEAPGAGSAQRESIGAAIEAAGGTVVGRVSFTEKFLTKADAGVVDEMSTRLRPSSMTFPPAATPYDKAATVLAGALMLPTVLPEGKETPPSKTILATFEEAGWLTLGENREQRATLAVVVASALPYEGETAAEQTAAVVSLAVGLDTASRGAVLVGQQAAAAEGGPIALLRDAEAKSAVSTVDNIDMASGQLAMDFALHDQIEGVTGHYGLGDGTTAFAPAPAPAATPTPDSGG
ncbi:copper transporter [Rhizohabitans arisaemae]|uniref:copper transporter n=1 Tax=Rhizohabitans arisaemae TaxID=2720610 RepID=UPI0024B19D87|nr:copper transporter [Rhizohabitans arisaemae]